MTHRPTPTAASYSLTAPVAAWLAEAGSTLTATARGEVIDPADLARLLLDLEDLHTASAHVAAGIAADPHICDPAGWAVAAALWAGVEGELAGASWEALVARWL